MKRVMWIVAMLPVLVTGIIFQFLPKQIPMHHDMAGNTDRWGGRVESFIFPVIILFIALFWHAMIHHFEKKVITAKNEKEQMEAKSAVKVLYIVSIGETVMFSIMHFIMLYSSALQGYSGGEKQPINMAKVSCFLCGVLFIFLGNFMTKAKKNGAVGVRTSWSMYNDNTWRESNRVGAICLIVAGLLTVITTGLATATLSTIFMIIYILLTVVITSVYSARVYKREKQEDCGKLS